ncbi:hypothetical protein SLEP1_g27315 [Rubroshorea leprosula]|uniref:Uncharacterized protein n=1 Tax=Rubroshorea leprosula TaxID=152421 RepID=A0AAV5JZQ5_9ROSI|nr:hypothetical protein SLEP1_g27315 [Rubroshorea leprosula]
MDKTPQILGQKKKIVGLTSSPPNSLSSPLSSPFNPRRAVLHRVLEGTQPLGFVGTQELGSFENPWVLSRTQALGSRKNQGARFLLKPRPWAEPKRWVLEGTQLPGFEKKPSTWVPSRTQALGSRKNPDAGFLLEPRQLGSSQDLGSNEPNTWVLTNPAPGFFLEPKAWVPTNPALGFSKEPSHLGSRKNPGARFLLEPRRLGSFENPAPGFFPRPQELGRFEKEDAGGRR